MAASQVVLYFDRQEDAVQFTLAASSVIADGAPGEILAGGTYFATETARILGGAGAALTPEEGALVLHALSGDEVLA